MNNQLLAQVDLQDVLFRDHPGASSISGSPTLWISEILPNVFVVASLILFAYLVFGGFIIITSAGSSDQVQKGQQAVTNAIIGFIIIFASYWIIQIIQVLTGVPILQGLQGGIL